MDEGETQDLSTYGSTNYDEEFMGDIEMYYDSDDE